MKTYKVLKNIILSFAIALVFGLVLAGGVDAKAAVTTVTETEESKPQIYAVGDHITIYDASDLKINNKKPKKIRKKVKTVASVTDPTAYYIPASYYSQYKYSDSYPEEAYATYADYRNAQNNYSYYAATDYYFCFQKPGTYTFTYYTYSAYTKRTEVPGKDYYSYDVEVTKTLHTKVYKVVKNTSIIKSITLGSAKVKSNNKSTAAGKTTSTYVRNQYLKGNSGKLKVSLNKGYKIMSIVVVTYDEKGNTVYTQAVNKGTVAFGQYVRDSYATATNPKPNRTDKRLMKETKVYIGYMNELTGEYTKHTVKKDEYGSYVETEYKYYGKTEQPYTTRGITGNCYLSYTFYKQ